ncbi:MAG: type II toxin-antitoxin system VapC family toxin [Ilumatobacteraceae bacterium]
MRERLRGDEEHGAPHVIDVEVLNVIRRDRLLGRLEPLGADQAIADLRDWPGERFGHRSLIDRAWDLRDRVRGWDAFYVALAEALDAPLVTSDLRLGRVRGLRCAVEVIG